MRKYVNHRQGALPFCFVYLFMLILPACSTHPPAPSNTPFLTEAPTISATATITPSPMPLIPTQSPPPPSTATPDPVICSLLDGVETQELPMLITNPFSPPRLGSDDPHQGVDFSVIDPVYQIALEGQPVQAVMDGVVAGVIDDRFPYGNAILVETPL
jgi:murein DD-endopeptidase MepM/ murein hydrolase activator NlpD